MPVDDDIYWNSIDFGSDGNNKSPYSRKYVDPWDLENYAYIREHLNHSADLNSDSNSSVQFSGENYSTSFYYTPERHESRSSKDYCAIDEVKHVEDGPKGRDFRRDEPPESVFTMFSSTQDGMALPLPDDVIRGISKHGFSKKRDVPEKSQVQNSSRGYHSSFEPSKESKNKTDFKMRQITAAGDNKMYPDPKHKFDLTNYGHLKIDYSYSWINLDKYICN